MIISDALTWDSDIEYISKKLTPNINLLQLCRPFLNNRSAIFYYQLFFCHVIYGLHIYWNLARRYVTDILFLLQKRAFRIIANIQHIPLSLILTKEPSSNFKLITLPSLIKHFSSYKVKIFLIYVMTLNYTLPTLIFLTTLYSYHF